MRHKQTKSISADGESIFGRAHLPVLGLVDAAGVGLGVLALRVEGGDGGAELRHGVQGGGEVVEHGDHVGRKSSPVGPLLGQCLSLQTQ